MARTSKKKDSDIEETAPIEPVITQEPAPLPEIAEPPALDAQPEPEPIAEAESSAEPTLEPEPEKRRPGRPSKNDPPIVRSGIIDRIQNLASWEGTRVYLYRWEPFTDRKVGGRSSVSVKRYEGPFDEEDIMTDPGLGSGVYELVMNRTDPQTRQRRMIDSGMVKILNMKYPPRIPKGEWQDDERNKDWEWCRNLVGKDEAAGAVPMPARPADALVEIMREQLAAQRMETAELRKEMREAAAKKDPTEQTLISIIVPFVPAIVARLTAPATPDPTQALFMQYLMKQAEAKQEAVAAPDPMKSLEQQFELSSKMEERYGNRGGRSRKSATQEFVADMTAAAAPILAPIVQVIAQGLLQQQRTQQQQPQPQPAQYQPQPVQYQPPQVAAPPTPSPSAGQAPPANLSPAPGPQIVKDAPNIEVIAQAVVDHVESNLSGVDLGDWYIEKYGREEFDEVRMQGKSAIIRDLNAVPLFEKAELENGIVDQLISDFLLWEPAEDNDEDDEDEPPAAVAPIKSGWTQPVAAQEPSR